MGGAASNNAAGAAACIDYRPGQEGRFFCKGGTCGSIGVVWGSNPYTADSCVCQAARHAGVIGAAGGAFNVKKTTGPKEYGASVSNGVTSYDYKDDPNAITILSDKPK